MRCDGWEPAYFPSFSEGLSLRAERGVAHEGHSVVGFPFLFGGTFIEGFRKSFIESARENFPSFSEGLSLRVTFFLHG